MCLFLQNFRVVFSNNLLLGKIYFFYKICYCKKNDDDDDDERRKKTKKKYMLIRNLDGNLCSAHNDQ